MAWKWFVQTGERVEGPLSTDDVQAKLKAGLFGSNSLIWGPGVDAWVNMQTWSINLSGLQSADAPAGMETYSESWHYAVGGQSKGPVSREDLVRELKEVGSGDIMLWTKGMKEWAPLYEFHDLLTEIGINKRQFPRAEVTGKVILNGNNGTTMIAPLLSISEGGFGVGLDAGYVSGETVTAEIQITVFRDSLHVKA